MNAVMRFSYHENVDLVRCFHRPHSRLYLTLNKGRFQSYFQIATPGLVIRQILAALACAVPWNRSQTCLVCFRNAQKPKLSSNPRKAKSNFKKSKNAQKLLCLARRCQEPPVLPDQPQRRSAWLLPKCEPSRPKSPRLQPSKRLKGWVTCSERGRIPLRLTQWPHL